MLKWSPTPRKSDKFNDILTTSYVIDELVVIENTKNYHIRKANSLQDVSSGDNNGVPGVSRQSGRYLTVNSYPPNDMLSKSLDESRLSSSLRSLNNSHHRLPPSPLILSVSFTPHTPSPPATPFTPIETPPFTPYIPIPTPNSPPSDSTPDFEKSSINYTTPASEPTVEGSSPPRSSCKKLKKSQSLIKRFSFTKFSLRRKKVVEKVNDSDNVKNDTKLENQNQHQPNLERTRSEIPQTKLTKQSKGFLNKINFKFSTSTFSLNTNIDNRHDNNQSIVKLKKKRFFTSSSLQNLTLDTTKYSICPTYCPPL